MLPDPIFLNVHMYGVMIAVGILCCFGVLYLYGKKQNINEKFLDFVFYNGIASIVVGFGSATLFSAFYHWLDEPEKGFKLGQSFTFIGGLIGGAATFLIVYFIFRKRLSMRLFKFLPTAPCCILIAHAFGRMGCFFAGCCYGKETNSWLGMKFPRLQEPVYPTQLYEAIFLFILFAVCSYLLLKKAAKHNMSVYLIAYGVFRFAIEYLRGDNRGKLLGVLSPSQFWSVCMVILGIALIFLMNYLYKREETVITEEIKE